MNVLITGSSGLIGQRLRPLLAAKHTVLRLLRRPSQEPNTFYWAPDSPKNIDPKATKDADAIIHLAGASIAEHRWTNHRKDDLRSNRTQSLRTLANTLTPANAPKTFIIASAIGYYDKTDPAAKTENSPNGHSFDAELCQLIETTLNPEKFPNTRFVFLRLGVVLSPNGGALAKMLPPFQLGLGGMLGNGKQPFAWVSLTDAARAIEFCLENENISGPVNVTAPARETNASFTHTLGKVLRRPTCLPMPKLAVKLLFGEMGEELLLKGTYVMPEVLAAHNFSFEHPTLEEALRAELQGKTQG